MSVILMAKLLVAAMNVLPVSIALGTVLGMHRIRKHRTIESLSKSI